MIEVTFLLAVVICVGTVVCAFLVMIAFVAAWVGVGVWRDRARRRFMHIPHSDIDHAATTGQFYVPRSLRDAK